MKLTSKKVKSTKAVASREVVVVKHSRRQRVLGFIALTGLFLCGLFVGMGIVSQNKKVVAAAAPAPVVKEEYVAPVTEPQSVCAEIERLISRRLPAETDDADDRIERAKIFATLAERGCPENSAAFVEHARLELEVARAIEDDDFDHDEAIEVVETYKRLQMQNAAQEILDKAKKIANPAIDFIIELEKIINE